MENVQPVKEHQWLQQLLGEWSASGSMPAEPGKEPDTWTVDETVRPIGELWIQAESRGKMPDGGAATNLLTLGYDKKKQRFVGTWLGSMMDFMWVYDGQLDAAGKVLTLDTEGPDCFGKKPSARYREVIEIKGPGERTFTSHVQGEDGEWTLVMQSVYKRKA